MEIFDLPEFDEWLICPVCKGEYCNKTTCPECHVDLVDELPEEEDGDEDDARRI